MQPPHLVCLFFSLPKLFLSFTNNFSKYLYTIIETLHVIWLQIGDHWTPKDCFLTNYMIPLFVLFKVFPNIQLMSSVLIPFTYLKIWPGDKKNHCTLFFCVSNRKSSSYRVVLSINFNIWLYFRFHFI